MRSRFSQKIIGTMEHISEEAQRFLRQFFLIRYNSLIERIKLKLPGQLSDEAHTKLNEAILNVAWIDDTLNEVKTR